MDAKTLLETEQSEPVRAHLQNIVDNPDPIYAKMKADRERDEEKKNSKPDYTEVWKQLHDYQTTCASHLQPALAVPVQARTQTPLPLWPNTAQDDVEKMGNNYVVKHTRSWVVEKDEVVPTPVQTNVPTYKHVCYFTEAVLNKMFVSE